MENNNEKLGTKNETTNHNELKMEVKISWNMTNTTKSHNEESGELVVDREDENKGELSYTLNGENTKTFLSLAVDVLADKLKEKFGSGEKPADENDPE